MRLDQEKAVFLKEEISKLGFNSKGYLFGSRTDDSKRGGDIDILILSSDLLSKKELWMVKERFWARFGEQKLDLVNFTFDSQDPFKKISMAEALPL